jgi:hypothetical protein
MRNLAILSVLSLFAPAVSAAPALGDKPPKWEYAELEFSRVYIPGQPGAGRPVPQVTVRWTMAGDEVEGSSWQNLADKLKAPAPKKEASVTQHKLRVFNQLGADGWEMIEHTGTDGIRESGTERAKWTFKRRAP